VPELRSMLDEIELQTEIDKERVEDQIVELQQIILNLVHMMVLIFAGTVLLTIRMCYRLSKVEQDYYF